METSPFLHPAFLFSVLGSLIALVAWFIRLESKINTNAALLSRVEHDLNKVENQFEAHRQNQEIHFNLRINQQVEKANDRRFATLEEELKEINRKLDALAKNK